MCNIVDVSEKQQAYICGFSSRFLVDGKKLTDARMAAQMSMEDVATALGCNKSSVSRWEQGILVPSEDRAFKLAAMFKTMEFLIGNPNYQKRVGSKGKLTPDKAKEIRDRVAAGELKSTLAKEFGVTRWAIWAVCTGKVWKQTEFETGGSK